MQFLYIEGTSDILLRGKDAFDCSNHAFIFVLALDMGLGKTLQSICIIAGDAHLRDQEYQVLSSVVQRTFLWHTEI